MHPLTHLPARRPAPIPFLTIVVAALMGFLAITGATTHTDPEPRLFVYGATDTHMTVADPTGGRQ